MDNHIVMHPAVKLRHLRAFLAIATSGGMTSVAQAQGITQPALSRTLAELEELLGQPLFLRQGRKLVLTDAGNLFRRHATTALQVLDAGAAALHPNKGERLRIGVLPSVATTFFPRVAMRFSDLQPETVLAVETGPHHYLIQLLREGAIDLMVGRMPTATEMTGLRFDHLYEEDVLLVARAGHPFVTSPVADALEQSLLILPPQTALIRTMVDTFMASLGFSAKRASLETVSLALGRGVCLASDALWFISRGVVADELARGRLVALPLGVRFLSGAVGLTRRQTPSEAQLDTLEQIAREFARSDCQDQP